MRKLLLVIEEEKTVGKGTTENPFRVEKNRYSLDGKLLTFWDDWMLGRCEEITAELKAVKAENAELLKKVKK
ncbi:MAG TPA: hypothetical protein VMQ76_12690 [Terracidiphilus sp.]|nr:hypothetical protein [Terracidiphilus sp.]